jgi:diaminopimelate epimerase
MQIPYKKMHGTGNLILVIDQRHGNLPPPSSSKLQELSDEKTGPGFDQLMWLSPSKNEEYLASYRVFNSDGSEAEQCGNGVRCVAQYLAGIEKNAKSFTLMSPAGLVSARVYEDGLVEVSMGVPNFEPSNIPFVASKNQLSYELIVDNKTIEINVLSMGNPHAVLQVDDINIAPVSQIGPLIEIHERFPERTNVGFMHITDKANIELRVHERGAGETAACGTGACAAVVSGQRLGLLDKEVSVQLPGGQVVVSWLGSDAPVWLKGNAVLIEEGTMNL